MTLDELFRTVREHAEHLPTPLAREIMAWCDEDRRAGFRASSGAKPLKEMMSIQ